jgi:diadenosine tetraphosphatase ApaH/serine/threonine PP2A family protein phosphatase
MRYLVLSDIHSNLEALEACLLDADIRRYDRTLILGDVVGYGSDPNAVIARVQALAPSAIVRGNHDKAACGIDDAEGFNAVARHAAIWTADALTEGSRHWLRAMPAGPLLVDSTIEVCHGSPLDEDDYIFDELDGLRALRASERPLCLFGHTHCPIAYELSGDADEAAVLRGVQRMELRSASKSLINPGAVGQPRDGDPRAAYAVVDVAADRCTVDLVRVPYPFRITQRKILEAGLPDALARRLATGR